MYGIRRTVIFPEKKVHPCPVLIAATEVFSSHGLKTKCQQRAGLRSEWKTNDLFAGRTAGRNIRVQ